MLSIAFGQLEQQVGLQMILHLIVLLLVLTLLYPLSYSQQEQSSECPYCACASPAYRASSTGIELVNQLSLGRVTSLSLLTCSSSSYWFCSLLLVSLSSRKFPPPSTPSDIRSNLCLMFSAHDELPFRELRHHLKQ